MDVLVRAFFDGTLQPINPCACAVGNLICAANGLAMQARPSGRIVSPATGWMGLIRGVKPRPDDDKMLGWLANTGYALRELNRIERAFEGGAILAGDLDETVRAHSGLMAVLDVLFDIHGVAADEKPAHIARFSHPALAPA